MSQTNITVCDVCDATIPHNQHSYTYSDPEVPNINQGLLDIILEDQDIEDTCPSCRRALHDACAPHFLQATNDFIGRVEAIKDNKLTKTP
jgi:hypothetical protein